MSVANSHIWVVFNIAVFVLLMVDMFWLAPKDKELRFQDALRMTFFWVFLALLFNVGIYYAWGKQIALEFLAGYLIEQSLSVDNLFVFLLIFSYFKVPTMYQRKILFWGIIGAQIMRAIFIFVGVAVLQKFHWFIYIFGGLLIFSGVKLFTEKEKKINPQENPLIKALGKVMAVSREYHQGKFFIKEAGQWVATPLLVVLVVVETTDLVFAVDSIPAVLAITKDPFIVYSSNILAILGLRAMYFALSGLMGMFHLLHYGLGIILIFVGVKMVGENFFHISTVLSLGFIVTVLGVTIGLSLAYPARQKERLG